MSLWSLETGRIDLWEGGSCIHEENHEGLASGWYDRRKVLRRGVLDTRKKKIIGSEGMADRVADIEYISYLASDGKDRSCCRMDGGITD